MSAITAFISSMYHPDPGAPHQLMTLRDGKADPYMPKIMPPFETPLVPFGVFLAPAALLTLFWGDALLAWITRA